MCEGDARRALNALEVAVLTTEPGPDGVIGVTQAVAEASIQKKAVVYDHDEDGHYDTISAFIKSVRGSDPHAAIYWLAKMLYAGEDPRFVARRLVILASEDIGNADPRGLRWRCRRCTLWNSWACRRRGSRWRRRRPTCHGAQEQRRLPGREKAMEDVKNGRTLPVPDQLRNIKMRSVGKAEGKEYVYPHDFAGHSWTRNICRHRRFTTRGRRGVRGYNPKKDGTLGDGACRLP